MTQETDAMQERITNWLPKAKRQRNALTKQIATLTGAAKMTAMAQRDALRHQINALERELEEPLTDAFEHNSHENVEMGLSG